MTLTNLFTTPLYRADLSDKIDQQELQNSCLVIADDDEAGQDWCEAHNFPGYTSYASLSDLIWATRRCNWKTSGSTSSPPAGSTPGISTRIR